MSIKVLALGDLERIQSRFGGPGVEIVEENPPSDNTYDLVVMDHVLQLASRMQVAQLIKIYKMALKIGGDLVIFVPSLEWAASLIATNDDPPATAYFSIYGGDNEPHLSGMTLLWLRALAQQAGMHVKQATGEWYLARIGEDEEKVMQNVLIATRVAEGDRSEAFE